MWERLRGGEGEAMGWRVGGGGVMVREGSCRYSDR